MEVKEESLILLNNLVEKKALENEDLKKLLEETYFLLHNYSEFEEVYNFCLKCICHICELRPKDPLIRELLRECISASRIFLYDDVMLKDYFGEEINILRDVSRSLYTLSDGTVLTKDQYLLFEEFQKNRRIIVSAPTSFGKSKIIEEIIKFNKFQNILIILPTLALGSEFYLKFKNIRVIIFYFFIEFY